MTASENVTTSENASASDGNLGKLIGPNVEERVMCALHQLGFSKREATKAITSVRATQMAMAHDVASLLRAAVQALTVASARH